MISRTDSLLHSDNVLKQDFVMTTFCSEKADFRVRVKYFTGKPGPEVARFLVRGGSAFRGVFDHRDLRHQQIRTIPFRIPCILVYFVFLYFY